MRVELGERRLGFHHRSCQQLASADLAFPRLGLPNPWPETGRTSSDQSAVSSCQHAPAFCPAALYDRCAVAQRVGGGALRVASDARRICGVDFRAQGCVKRVLLAADHACIRAICHRFATAGSAGEGVVLPRAARLCAGAFVQTNAGDAAIRVVASGLLAAPGGEVRSAECGVRNFGRADSRHLCLGSSWFWKKCLFWPWRWLQAW